MNSAAQRSKMYHFFITRFILIAGTLACLAILLFFFVKLSNQHEDEQNRIINMLGKQRMLTQQMAKDANRIASLLEAIGSDNRVQDITHLSEKLNVVKSALTNSAVQFENNLSQIEDGKLLVSVSNRLKSYVFYTDSDKEFISTVQKIRAAWDSFYPAVKTAAVSVYKDYDFRNAIIVINEQNENLLHLSDEISAMTVEKFSRTIRRERTSLAVLGVCLLVLIIWILFSTYRLILEPYNFFYRGITKMGVPEIQKKEAHKKHYSALEDEVFETFAILKEMANLNAVISKGCSFPETLNMIFTTFRAYIPYDYIGIATFTGYRGTKLSASYGESGGSFPNLPIILGSASWDIGYTSLGKILTSDEPRIINDLESYAATRPPREYTQILLKEGIRASITLSLVLNGIPLGFLFFSSKNKGVYNELHVSFLRNIRNTIALAFEKNIFVDELVYASTLALAKMAEARDEDTADHLERMSQYSVLLTKCLRDDGLFSEIITLEFIKEIERFSPMHDIGKVGIRDNVLLKPGKLDDSEWVHMKTHTTYGSKVLQEAENSVSLGGKSLFTMGIRIAESHHEKWDGSGYPHGLYGDQIPLEARIVAIADVFDALTTKRPYKRAFSFDESLSIMNDGKGKHFDPVIFSCFERNIKMFEALHNHFLAEE